METPNQNAQPRAALVPVPLSNEPATDAAFKNTEDTLTYRARLVEVDTASAQIPMANHSPAPFLRAYDLSIVQLDDQGKPVVDALGNVIVSGQTRVTLDANSMAREDPRVTLQRIIEQEIYRASKMHATQAALSAITANWSASISASVTLSK